MICFGFVIAKDLFFPDYLDNVLVNFTSRTVVRIALLSDSKATCSAYLIELL